ncbi:MAG: hypothetical protein ACOX9E_05685 [Lentisphaeria bacterium]
MDSMDNMDSMDGGRAGVVVHRVHRVHRVHIVHRSMAWRQPRNLALSCTLVTDNVERFVMALASAAAWH